MCKCVNTQDNFMQTGNASNSKPEQNIERHLWNVHSCMYESWISKYGQSCCGYALLFLAINEAAAKEHRCFIKWSSKHLGTDACTYLLCFLSLSLSDLIRQWMYKCCRRMEPTHRFSQYQTMSTISVPIKTPKWSFMVINGIFSCQITFHIRWMDMVANRRAYISLR